MTEVQGSTQSTTCQIPLCRPDITDHERARVLAVLAGSTLSIGPEITAFERAICRYTGAEHAVGTSSGTAALHLAIRGLEIGSGDEVVTSPFSFIASANAILYEDARPIFADVDPDTLNLDPGAAEAVVTGRTRALLVVHVFGNPADMESLSDLARRRDLKIVEDACEALGARTPQGMAGTVGDAGVYAFYPNKQITAAEGGMLVTPHPRLARQAQSERNQGRAPEGFRFERLGYNYRMSELHAALGRAQLERIDGILGRRRRVATAYRERLAGMSAVAPLPLIPGESPFVFVVRAESARLRDRLREGLGDRGIATGLYFPPIHLEPPYRERFGFRTGQFPVAEEAGRTLMALPFYSGLPEEAIETVCRTIREITGP